MSKTLESKFPFSFIPSKTHTHTTTYKKVDLRKWNKQSVLPSASFCNCQEVCVAVYLELIFPLYNSGLEKMVSLTIRKTTNSTTKSAQFAYRTNTLLNLVTVVRSFNWDLIAKDECRWKKLLKGFAVALLSFRYWSSYVWKNIVWIISHVFRLFFAVTSSNSILHTESRNAWLQLKDILLAEM